MSVDRNNNDLSRFRYSCPAWWDGFSRGRREERERAIKQLANWQRADFQRGKAAEISEDAA